MKLFKFLSVANRSRYFTIRNYADNPYLIFLLKLFDYILLLPLIISTPVFYIYSRIGGRRLPKSRGFIKRFGVYPIRNHYYYPLFDDSKLKHPLDSPRELPGINLNINLQLSFLRSLDYTEELVALKLNDVKSDITEFSLGNGSFEAGDAEFLYSMIRYLKPNLMLEIGSGYSTKIANQALKKNFSEDRIITKHICIEPYEMPWLERLDVIVERQLIEDIDHEIFNKLEKNDMLFIDSSHIIRPQGDVLTLYLDIIPRLKKGVIVHVHDIFTPRNYPDAWIREDVKFWNEQYLLEALLSDSKRYEVISTLNYLHHNNYEDLKNICPYLQRIRNPASFYFRVN